MLTEMLDIVLTAKFWGNPKSGALGLSLFSLMVIPCLLMVVLYKQKHRIFK